MYKLGLLLACVLTISWAFECDPKIKDYNWPRSKDCKSYYHCHNGTATEDMCVTLFRKFNPETLKCDWAWKVNCSAVPHLPVPPTEEVKPEDPPAEPSEPAHEDVPHKPESVPNRPDTEEVNPPVEPSKPVDENVPPHKPESVPVKEEVPTLYPA